MGDYRYGAECQEGAGPHALCETSDGVRYRYDANGNMVGDSSGRRIEYSSFDKPVEITKDGHTTRFAYNPSRARYLRVDEDREGGTTLTRYLGNVERITHPDGRQEIKRRLPGGALISYTRSAGGQPAGKTTHYLHKDHLGSIDTISDENGQLVAQMSFDAWGQRRNALAWDALMESELREFDPYITDITKRGFTGHEMLDEVGLIHMNGRIYDPRLGRFMQADPQVQFPSDTQSYNRYSYTHNNPLRYTDSSGYGLDVFDVAKIVVATVITVFCEPCGPEAYAWALGSISGVQAAYNGGDVGQIAIAAFSGAVSGYLGGSLINGMDFGSYIGWSALSGGITAELQGGKFGHGFVSAGIGAASGGITKGISNIYVRAAVGTIVGGTLSEATGGKFANGAAMAAFRSIIASAASNETKINCKRQCNGEVSVDYSRLETPAEHQFFLDHLASLQGDSAVNQASLRVAMFNTSASLAYSSMQRITNKEIVQAVFERRYNQSQKNVAMGAAALMCGAYFAACTKAVSYYGYGQLAKSSYLFATSPSVGDGYALGVNVTREAFTKMAHQGAPAPIKPIIWFNAAVGEAAGRIPID